MVIIMNELIINTKDLLHNISEIKKHINKDNYTLIAVVKGNAYGLGILEFTRFLIGQGFHFFAVATYDEALLLRQNGINETILLMTPYYDYEILKELIKNNITLTVESEKNCKLISEIAKKLETDVTVHIKIDTGMSRYGFKYDSVKEIIDATHYENIYYEGIYSHLANALAKDEKFSNIQFSRFMEVINKLNQHKINFKMKHICNSPGFFRFPHMHLDAARIGSAFLGDSVGIKSNLIKIGLLHTKIISIRDLRKGDYIGYAKSYKVTKDTKVMVLSVGYYVGVGLDLRGQRFKVKSKIKHIYMSLKALFKSDIMYLKINNEYLKILGQIGMNNIVVDTGHNTFKENDDIYFYVKPIFIDSNIKRIYKN